MFEISATCLTPDCVLRASGHVDRFTDLLVTDSLTNQGYRADKIVTEVLEARIEKDKKLTPEAKAEYQIIIREIDTYNAVKMKEVIHKHNIKAIETGNDLTDPTPFNLMLATTIGPSTKIPAFLRPETA